MNRQDALDLMFNGMIEDMKDLYSRGGVSTSDAEAYLEQGKESFKVLCINMYDRLLEKGAING